MKNVSFFVVLVLVTYTVGCGSSAPIVVSVSPEPAFVGSGQVIQFVATVMGDTSGVNWFVGGIAGGNSTVGMIDSLGNYTAPNLAQNGTAEITAASKKDPSKAATVTANIIAPGTVTSTANPQVAQYTISPPSGLDVLIEFGPDTAYGLTTSASTSPTGGGMVSILVAGMRGNTAYHMRAIFQSSGKTLFSDSDHIFTTTAYLAANLPTITATTTAGMTPQSGVELLSLTNLNGGTKLQIAVTDLGGNVLWAYDPGASITAGSVPNPIKLLPNGHFLINFSGGFSDGINSVLQEVDLTGQVVWQLTAAQLNQALASATCAGCNITVSGTHHDFVSLPNGHLIVIASTQKVLADNTTATGDVLIDLGDMENVGGGNPTHTPIPVWLWNEFDHLDTNRRPYLYPDWTHTNAVIYSVDDGNLIVSIRHQNWLVKMDYSNGAGDGHVIWKLGFQGDIELLDSTGAPDSNDTDWFFAQHGPSFTTTNTTGKFSLILFDNGNDRGVTSVVGGTCGVSGQPDCYSTVPILNIDETAMTATLAFNPTTPDFSLFGGDAEILNNGDAEYDECAAVPFPASLGKIFEVPQSMPTQPVWQMEITGQDIYRGFRIPSLYPGVQW